MEKECLENSERAPLNKIQRIYAGYIQALRRVTKFFRKKSLDMIGDVIVSLCAEPVPSIRSSYYYNLGRGTPEDCRFYGLNPTQILDVKNNGVAILLVHGAGSSQGLWIPFAKRLEQEGFRNIFTTNIKRRESVWKYNKEAQEYEIQAVRDRINDIKQLYDDQIGAPPKIIILGHSRGGDIGSMLCDEFKEIITVVRLGKVTPGYELSSTCHKKLFEIEAAFDALCHWKSCLPSDSRRTVHTGHLGLLYSKKSHDVIIEVINEIVS